jgi:hypothetical protein
MSQGARRLCAAAGCLTAAVGCGDDSKRAPDAMPAQDAAALVDTTDAAVIPQGPHHGYVVSGLRVPISDPEVRDYAFDLGSKTSAMPDGTTENTVGTVFSAVSILGVDLQGAITAAVDRGTILMLVDVQAQDFANTSAAGLGVVLGADPVPAACDGPDDLVCRHHLDGSASFAVAPGSPAGTPAAGAIVDGTFHGGGGAITLQLAFGSAAPIQLGLAHAQVRASSISEAGIMTAMLGGVVSPAQVTAGLAPALQAQIAAVLDRDCTPGGAGTPPDCGCQTGTAGARLISVFDGDLAVADRNCTVTNDEILGNAVIQSALQPDACSKDTCAAADALSIGVKLETVKASFPR